MLTMLLLLSSAFTVLEKPMVVAQAPEPCGLTPKRPCYVRPTDGNRLTIEGNTFDNSSVTVRGPDSLMVQFPPDAGSEAEFAAIHSRFTAKATVDNSECMRALKVANEENEAKDHWGKFFLHWALSATVAGLVCFIMAISNWKTIFTAFKQAELRFTLPVEFKQFIVLLMCPFAFGVTAAALVKVGATFTGDSPRWFYWVAMAVAAFLGGGFGYDWAEAIERRGQK